MLQKFYVEIRKKEGGDYEPDSLKVMMACLDRYLKSKGYPVSIVSGVEFMQSRKVLDGKVRLPREENGQKANQGLRIDFSWQNLPQLL